ncbi:MAG: DUF1822 family protein [Nostocaceae cyanobacterium]|nr:DUF1822 family protein [Nostocaceae cyanobacterium]
MSLRTYELENFALTLPITQAGRTTAEQFANQQPTPRKAEQVRLNTLAVWVVNDYLQMMGMETDTSTSDCWNPVVRLCADVADLVIPGVGKLECRPLKPSEQMCYIPPETWEERVGYIFVQVDESLQEATLLGFVPSTTTEELPLTELQSLEDLIEHLAQPQQSIESPISNALVNLSEWVAGVFDAGWQTLEFYWNQPELKPVYAFRNAATVANQQNAPIRGAKLIDLGIQIAQQPVILIMEITPQEDRQISIRLQLQPTGNQIYLPPRIKLAVLDESGAVFLQAEARSADNYIQLQFRGEPDERFGVRVALDDAIMTQEFVI